MRFFFAADIHSSETCFRKFLNAVDIYGADVAVLLGDLRGKVIVPIVQSPEGTYSSDFLGRKTIAKNETEVTQLEKKIGAVGYYPYRATGEEIAKLQSNPELMDSLFQKFFSERIESWSKLAEERLAKSKAKLFIAAGNDDPLEIETTLNKSTRFVNVGDKKFEVDEHEIICCTYSGLTPWKTPRECEEDELAARIESLTSQVRDFENSIFLTHDPPIDTILDVCPKLSEDMTPSATDEIHAGSKAVLDAIKKYQPLLSIHGHIHESKGIIEIGRTICINPGSEYSQGILRGVIVDVVKGKVKTRMLTSG
jgi:Icc-related predicted phosphoesterase